MDEQTKSRIEKMIERFKIFEFNGMLKVDSSIARCPAEVEFLKKHKPEFIEILRARQAQAQEAEEAKKRAKYAELIARLPQRNFNNTPDQEKFAEIMSRIDTRSFSGYESDGLALSVQAENARIRQEAQQYCSHELKESFDYTYTGDARKKLVRTIECPKCGLRVQDVVEDDIDEEKVLNR